MQLGDTAGVTYDVRFDDAAFSTSRIGLGGDTTAPTQPGTFTANATDPFDVGLSWTSSTDNVGVSGYDLFRDGMLLAALPATATSYTDSTVLASTTYNYSLRARDAAGNVSAWSTASVTTPAAATPVFADGFESGNTSQWTTTGNVSAENTDVRTGTWAGEANAAGVASFVKKTVTGTYTDVYARVGFEVVGQTSQMTLLRLRNTPTGTGAFLFLSSGGSLGLHVDAPSSNTISSVKPGPGWHVVEVHLVINAANSVAGQTQVWLDGAVVSALSFSAIDLGTAAMGVVQLGDASAATYDVRFDDAAVSTSRIGIG
jgi:chitodextrinase